DHDQGPGLTECLCASSANSLSAAGYHCDTAIKPEFAQIQGSPRCFAAGCFIVAQSLFIEAMDSRFIRRQKHMLPMPKVDFAISARGHLAYAVDIHVQEGVGAQMLSNTDCSLPVAFSFRQGD